MLRPVYSSKFKKDITRAKKRGKKFDEFDRVASLLLSGAPLPSQYKDHALIGSWKPRRECHTKLRSNACLSVKRIQEQCGLNALPFRPLISNWSHLEPDWLLVYIRDFNEGVVIFDRTGTHSDLFE